MSELSNLDVQTKEKIEDWVKKLQIIREEAIEQDLCVPNLITLLIKEIKEEIE